MSDSDLRDALYQHDKEALAKALRRLSVPDLVDLLAVAKNEAAWQEQVAHAVDLEMPHCQCGEPATENNETSCEVHASSNQDYEAKKMKLAQEMPKLSAEVVETRAAQVTLAAFVAGRAGEKEEGVCYFHLCEEKTDTDGYEGGHYFFCDKHNNAMHRAKIYNAPFFSMAKERGTLAKASHHKTSWDQLKEKEVKP